MIKVIKNLLCLDYRLAYSIIFLKTLYNKETISIFATTENKHSFIRGSYNPESARCEKSNYSLCGKGDFGTGFAPKGADLVSRTQGLRLPHTVQIGSNPYR